MNARPTRRTTPLRLVIHVALSGLFVLGVALLALQFGTFSVDGHGTTVTAVPKGATGYKYKFVGHGAEPLFHTLNYDESSFTTGGQAGFGSPAPLSDGSCLFNNSTEVKTVWPVNTNILLRKTFTLPPTDHAHNMHIVGTVDNAAVVYLNGTMIGAGSSINCAVNRINLTVPDIRIRPGVNLLAVRGDDTGGVSFLDLQVVYDAVNATPIAANDTAQTHWTNSVTVPVLANDTDGDGDPLSVRDLTQPEHGSAVLNADGSVTYTPDGIHGGIDTFTYRASDGALGSDPAMVSIDLQNAAPVAADDAGSTTNDTPVTIRVLANDSDPDGDALSVADLTQPAHGSVDVNADGTVTFTPSNRHAGTETFTYRASDGPDSSDHATVFITVDDPTAPELSGVPDDRVVEATGPDGADFAFAPTATDLVDGDVAVDCTPPGPGFPFGSTTVECEASDAAGNTASQSFTVTVRDTTAPEIGNVGGDQFLEATGPEGARYDVAPTATDLVDGDVVVECTPPPGTVVPLGPTEVECRAGDTAGNVATVSFTVTVSDSNPPVLLLDDVSAEATGPDGEAVTYAAAAEDEIDGAVTPDCAPESGSVFPLGTTTVDCTATDASGNEAHGSFDVIVEDTTPPSVSVPADITVGSTGEVTIVTYSASAGDSVSGEIAPVCSPDSGSGFPVGSTMVNCQATDAAGNDSSGQFMVTVIDGKRPKKPKIWVPDDRVIKVRGPATGAVVKFRVAAIDGNGESLPVTCTPPSGSTFALGRTRVVCEATDSSGVTVSGRFFVLVKTTPPSTKWQCRDDRWKDFVSPSFDSERECVRYVERTRGHDHERGRDDELDDNNDRDRGNDHGDDNDRDERRDRD